MKHLFIKNLAKIITGDIIIRVIGFLSIPVLARLYTPDQFGFLELILSLTAFSLTFSYFGYEQAVTLPKNNSASFNLVSLSTIFLLFFSIIAVLGSFFWFEYFSNSNSNNIGLLIFFFPALLIFRGMNDLLIIWSSKRKRFGRTSLSEIGMKITEVSLKISLAFCGTVGLFIGSTASFLFSAAILIAVTIRHDRNLFQNISLSRMKNLFYEFKDFPKFNIAANIFKIATDRVPAFIITPFFGFHIMGFYTIGFKLINEPMSILGKSMGRVFYQSASAEYAETGDIRKTTENVFDIMLLMLVVPISFLSIFGKEIFSLILGENWSAAGEYTQILSILMLFRFLLQPLGFILNIMNKQRTSLIFNMTLSAASLGFLLLGALLANMKLALSLFSSSYSIIAIIYLAIILKTAKVTVSAQLKRSYFQIALAIPVITGFLLLKLFEKNIYICLGGSSLLIFIFYIILMSKYLKKNEGLLKKLLRRN